MQKTLVGLAILLGSCFRRNDECWVFVQSLQPRKTFVDGGTQVPLPIIF